MPPSVAPGSLKCSKHDRFSGSSLDAFKTCRQKVLTKSHDMQTYDLDMPHKKKNRVCVAVEQLMFEASSPWSELWFWVVERPYGARPCTGTRLDPSSAASPPPGGRRSHWCCGGCDWSGSANGA